MSQLPTISQHDFVQQVLTFNTNRMKEFYTNTNYTIMHCNEFAKQWGEEWLESQIDNYVSIKYHSSNKPRLNHYNIIN